jgi:hypothetical protein
MTLQYLIIGIIIAAILIYIGISTYRTIKQNVINKNYRCAGCAFYDTCQKNKKKPRKNLAK